MTTSGAIDTAAVADDTLLLELRHGRHVLPMTQLAMDLGLFDLLAARPADAAQVADHLGTTPRAAEAMLAVEAALGLLRADHDGRFTLTDVAATYLLRSSEFYRGRFLRPDDPGLTALRQASSPGDGAITPLAGDVSLLPDEEVRDFTERMAAFARPAAAALAAHPSLAGARRFLDVAGGSGSLAMAVAREHPGIECVVLDRGPVCRLAAERIAAEGLDGRVFTADQDMLGEEPWPADQDAVLFASVWHNWDPATCEELARRAYAALRPGGSVLVHELPLDARKDGPLAAACLSVTMLLSHRGKQYTREEMAAVLTAAGFVDVTVQQSFGLYAVVAGRRPQ
ncbi:methyltransferase [Kitasatospora mediocidica]|uniref:methyltransferase n=1 Tax=Kitasatospora mediocidica TaxID=58352 RepID=UPI0005615D13|nr:methyltransferase [Kitasatospora mediocidica]